MKDTEHIDDFCMRLNGLVTNIRSLREVVGETYVVKKLLRVVPTRFHQIASAIEQYGNLDTMSVEEVMGSLKAHEERVQGGSEINDIIFLTENENSKTKQEVEANTWYLDNGASNHMRGYREKFEILDRTVKGEVKFGDGSVFQIEGKVSIKSMCKNVEVRELYGVYYIPTLRRNIISLGQLSEEGNRVFLNGENLWVFDRCGQLLMQVKRSGIWLYKIHITKAKQQCLLTHREEEIWLWNHRLGHVNFKVMYLMSKHNMAQGLLALAQLNEDYSGCIMSKQIRKSFPFKTNFSAKYALDLIHVDLCGPITPSTPTGAEPSIQELRSDRGGEFFSKDFKYFCNEHGILRHYTAPYTSKNKFVVEHRNRTVMAMVRSLVNERQVPTKYWGEAVRHAVYVLNKLPMCLLSSITLYEAWYNRKPSVEHLKIFGSTAYMKVPSVYTTKLDDRSKLVVHFSREPGNKAYRLFEPDTNNIHVTHDAKFNEDQTWAWTPQNSSGPSVPGHCTLDISDTESSVTPDETPEGRTGRRRTVPNGVDEPLCFKQEVQEKVWKHGEITKHKARLVAKGYAQRQELEYEEVFAPVTRLETVCLILSLAAKNDWEVHHLDVKSAFLNGTLKEESLRSKSRSISPPYSSSSSSSMASLALDAPLPEGSMVVAECGKKSHTPMVVQEEPRELVQEREPLGPVLDWGPKGLTEKPLSGSQQNSLGARMAFNQAPVAFNFSARLALQHSPSGLFFARLAFLICQWRQNRRCEPVLRHYTSPYTPKQNFMVERRNRTFMAIVRSLVKERQVPTKYWGEAVRHAVYVLNKLPMCLLSSITLYEAWYNRKPSVEHLKIFGCTTYMKVPSVYTTKLDDRSKLVVHFSREPGNKAYRLFDPDTNNIHVTRDVKFDELGPGLLKTPVIYLFQATVHWTSVTHSLQSLPKKHLSYNLRTLASDLLFILPSTLHGEITKHKAPLVAKGYAQRQELDYEEVFAPVTRLENVCLILSLAAKNDWEVHQLDVKSAFLNGTLKEESLRSKSRSISPPYSSSSSSSMASSAHDAPLPEGSMVVAECGKKSHNPMEEPRELVQEREPWGPVLDWGPKGLTEKPLSGSQQNSLGAKNDWEVHHLDVKSAFLNGTLKEEAPRAWYTCLNHYLLQLGFVKCPFEYAVYSKRTSIEVLLVAYAKKVLERAGLAECNSLKYPIEYKLQMHMDREGTPVNPTYIKSVVGGLRYLVYTRPDIAYDVGIVCRYMERPAELHINVVKCIYRYVK
ncbi:uncharacterized protein LOC141713768 [Apium graveolens]|uniref:uncharacterized protein LOC141713768 n=1 Tax=Apium graveolens TaxID=4045 RepID=UPI003D7AEA1C